MTVNQILKKFKLSSQNNCNIGELNFRLLFHLIEMIK